MKNKAFIFLVLIIVFIGCKRDPIPKEAIEREKFINVLVDVHIAEGIARDRFRLKIDSVESSSLYLAVLDKYQVSEDQMLLTSLYYSRHQREYKKIYTQVLDNISILLEEENTKEELVFDVDSTIESKKLIKPE